MRIQKNRVLRLLFIYNADYQLHTKTQMAQYLFNSKYNMKEDIKNKMAILKRSTLSILLFLIIASYAFSQNVGINAGGAAAPDISAGLDINFTTRGLLIPRVALNTISNSYPLPAHLAGIIVYNTSQNGDVTPGFYFNDGTKWIAGFPKPAAAGDMSFWDGTSWKSIPVGQPGQLLQINSSGVPAWSGAGYASSTTVAVTGISATSATTGGTITSDGGTAITSRGVCWSTTTAPTIADVKTVDGSGTGSFVSNITGLAAGTVYFVRAYATNSTGTSYGNQLTFVTQ
jgi:hypothetical protein